MLGEMLPASAGLSCLILLQTAKQIKKIKIQGFLQTRAEFSPRS